MKKSIEKFLIVIMIVSLAFGIIGLNYSYASEATISVGTAKVGQDFTVTINMPADAVGYEYSGGDIYLANGTNIPIGRDGDCKTDLTYIGNKTLTFKTSVAGDARVVIRGLIISDKNANKINSQSTLEQSFTVAAADAQPPAQTPPSTTPTTTDDEPGYTKTGDTVYALEKLNVRKSASTSGEKIGALNKDDKTTRISVGDNGWDKISFNGGTGYVMSKYLTTKSPEERAKEEPKWTDKNDTVYSLADVNVREGWGTSYKTVGGLSVGDEVKRIATGENGWSKIEYEGKTAYVSSKYLTTDKAKVDEKLAELEEDTVDENTTVDDNTVTNEAVDQDIYNTIVDEIGVLPQVGTSTGDYIYYISMIASIVMVAVVGVRIRNKEIDE